MFDSQRLMTARQLYFTLAAAFASHVYGQRVSWRLNEEPGWGLGASGVPAHGGEWSFHEQTENQTAALAPRAAENDSHGVSAPAAIPQHTQPMQCSEPPSHETYDDSQLPVGSRMRLSETVKSTGYAPGAPKKQIRRLFSEEEHCVVSTCCALF